MAKHFQRNAYGKSGNGIKYIGMSKKGRRVPEEILFNVAKTAINTDPYVNRIYTDYVERGKNRMAAIVPRPVGE